MENELSSKNSIQIGPKIDTRLQAPVFPSIFGLSSSLIARTSVTDIYVPLSALLSEHRNSFVSQNDGKISATVLSSQQILNKDYAVGVLGFIMNI